jgi:Holliday junction resolvase
MKLESKIQSEIIKYLKNNDYTVIKIILCNYNGCPDIIALKQGKTIFIEVKSEVGVLSELQKVRIAELEKQKFECYVVKSLNELKEKIT